MRPGFSMKLAGPDDVSVLLDQIAARIAIDFCAESAVVGIIRRGAPLARLIGERLANRGHEPPIGELKLKRYDDDLALLHDEPALDESTLDIDLHGRHVILVDDVLYSGHTLFRAVEFVQDQGASRIQLAVLCRRGNSDVPVRADHVGLQLDVGERWIIDISVPPFEDTLAIHINPRPEA